MINRIDGITLIALVISIIVMLILAGVSLNATIGDNGIITRAQETNYAQSVAVLEEYLNQYYVEHYEELKDSENKAVSLKNNKNTSSWFYQGAPLGYVVDSDGNAHYFINKAGLPDEIKSQIVGGDAKGKNEDEITYQDYASMTDVYGVTGNLKVYYCRGGSDTLIGLAKENLDKADLTKEIFPAGSAMSKLVTGSDDENLTLEDLKLINKLTINSSSGIKDLTDLYAFVSLRELTIDGMTLENLDGIENAPQLNFIYLKSSVVADYSALRKINSSLNKLYLYNVNDDEVSKLCDSKKGIGNCDFTKLEYFAISGNALYISATSGSIDNAKSPKKITTLLPLKNLSDTTKKAIKYLSLQCNEITDTEEISNIEYIKNFTNLYLLRVEYNQLKTLKGLENMNNLAYLLARGNKLGDYETEVKSLDNDSIASLQNKTKLILLNLQDNTNLRHISYIANNSSISYLFLSGCPNFIHSEVVEIRDLYLRVATINKNIDSIYSLLFNSDTRIDYSNQSLSDSSMEIAGLKNNLTCQELSLAGNTNLTNNKLQEILSSMTNLKYLSLRGLKNLSTIDFVNSVTGLIEIDLTGTSATDLTLLNTKATKLKTIYIDNPNIELKNIQTTIARCNGYTNNGKWNSYGGLWITNNTLLKKLEDCTDLTYLSFRSCGDGITLNLSKLTKLKNVQFHATTMKVIYPANIQVITEDYVGVPDLSNCISLSTFYDAGAKFTQEEFDKIVSDLGHNPNLTTFQYRVANAYVNNLDCFENLKNSNLNTFEFLVHTGYINETGLNNIDGIKYLKKLQNCTITSSKVIDISALSNNTSLISLNLSNNYISNLKPLENLKSLETLNLSNNNIYEISNGENGVIYNNLELLANLNKTGALRKLYLSGNNGIKDWTILSSITNWTEKSGW